MGFCVLSLSQSHRFPPPDVFLYGLTRTSFHVTFTASGSTDTHPYYKTLAAGERPLLPPQALALLWLVEADVEGSVMSSVVIGPQSTAAAQAASSLFNKVKDVNSHPKCVNGTHAVTSLMTSHLHHSAVQSDTSWQWPRLHIRMCFCLLFFFFFFTV